MVRASIDPTTAVAGGFVLIPVRQLMAAWDACRAGPLGIGHFRAWLACREMLARRRGAGHRAPTYAAGELATLLGCAGKRARASVRALEAAGLLAWSSSAISFPGPDGGDEARLGNSIGAGRGAVAIPRRLLRFLCRGARPAVIAAALAILCRCLGRRKSGFTSRGRIKAGWIADAFAISLRQAKAARTRLVRVGWIEAEPSEPWAERRWGRRYRINLRWEPGPAPDGPADDGPAPVPQPPPAGPTLTPQPPPAGPTLTPPDLQTWIPSGTSKNQDPGQPGPAGVRLESRGDEAQGPPPPRLADVRAEDLRDDGRLLELHRQAIARGSVGPSEADRLRFLAAAEHALAAGKANPCGLFAYLVRHGAWRNLTQADEDAARARLRRQRQGPPGAGDRGGRAGAATRASGADAGLSADAILVREIRTATIRAGIFRDPWPAFSARAPAWDRPRWDRAMVELGLG